jgi:hypothetical protein
MCENGGSSNVTASVKCVLCFVGVRSSLGIGVSGRSLNVRAIDGLQQLSISLLAGVRGPCCADGRVVASRLDDESGDSGLDEDKDVFWRLSFDEREGPA